MRGLLVFTAAWLMTLTAASGYMPDADRLTPASQRLLSSSIQPSSSSDVLKQYCVSCHNEKMHTAGLILDRMNPVDLGEHAEEWEKVVRKLRARSMPPAGRPRPDEASYERVAAQLEAGLDRVAAANPNPGRLPAFHRLTRTEYRNVIRDLLALDELPKEMDLAVLLPADNSSSGFDNLADLLFVSSTQLEQYLSAARKISRLAVGDPTIPPIGDTYQMSNELNQEFQADGAPFGTRGGTVIRTYLPLDGDYTIHVTLADAPRESHQLEVSVDGRRVQLFAISDKPAADQTSPTGATAKTSAQPSAETLAAALSEQAAKIEIGAVVNRRFERDRQAEARRAAIAKGFETVVPLKAGPREVTVTFLKKTSALSEGIVRSRVRGRGQQPAVASVTIRGPQNATTAGDTLSRRRIFVCRPSTVDQDTACAKQILSSLARRAYRRPVTDSDLQPLLSIYSAARSDRPFEGAIEEALQRILVSPQFLFRIERDPSRMATIKTAQSAAPSRAYPISDLELASRLSFFLWSSIPDDELLHVASAGKLREPREFERQVRRMLADARARSLATNFAAQWLYLRDVEAKSPSPRLFPNFDVGLRNAFQRETELFLESVFTEDRSALELLTANYTFVNERLARHYGIPNVFGNQFRRVTYSEDSPRRGLLGQASILLLTSYSNRTSPVLRGKYVLANLLGAAPPPPPDDVPALVTQAKESTKNLSMREAMVQHRVNPACASCHAQMDPIGFALDNFDAVGRWRAVSESGAPIDASGVFPDGTKFDGVAGLRQVLLSRPERFVTTLTENLLTYSLGRSLGYYDAPVVRAIVRDAAASDYRLSSVILGVVKSMPFQMRGSQPGAAPQSQKVSASNQR